MDPCPNCERSNFTSPSGRTLHVKTCANTVSKENVALPNCPSCNKTGFTSKSGRTLHIQTCDGQPELQLVLPEDDGVFTLEVYSFVKPIDPKRYFVTSGEAIAKAQKLEKDLWESAGLARKLVKVLESTRAEAKYLETSWENGQLRLRKKNPRKKANVSNEDEQEEYGREE